MIAILVQLLIIIIVVVIALKLNDLLVPDGKIRQAIYWIVVAIALILVVKLLYTLLMVGNVL